MYDVIVSLFFKSIEISYKWLNENLVSHVLTFSKEFGAVMVFLSAVAFLLIMVYFIMKQARRLPRRYVLETFDRDGKRKVIPELRVTFVTFQAAASYAEFYTRLYEGKYKFKLLGIKDNISVARRMD